MKHILVLIALFISAISITVTSIWAVVEFILYIAKDNPFDWWSVWLMIISVILTILFYILTVILEVKRDEMNKRFKHESFQDRIEKARKERDNK